MRISASRMKTWGECSLQAYYKYNEKRPTRQNAKASFGSIIHHSLASYNENGDLDKAKAMFKEEWAHPEKVGLEPDYWPRMTSFGSLMAKGIDILEAAANQHRYTNRTVLAVEHPFLVRMGDVELTGVVDLVEITKSGTGAELLRCVDYKTASREPNKSALALDPQFTIYMYAIGQREFWCGSPDDDSFPALPNGEWWYESTKGMTKRAIWWALWTQKQIDAGPRTEADFARLYRVCTEIEKADAAGIYVPRIGEACELCDFTELCALEIPVSVRALNDTSDPNRWL